LRLQTQAVVRDPGQMNSGTGAINRIMELMSDGAGRNLVAGKTWCDTRLIDTYRKTAAIDY